MLIPKPELLPVFEGPGEIKLIDYKTYRCQDFYTTYDLVSKYENQSDIYDHCLKFQNSINLYTLDGAQRTYIL